MPSEVIDSKPAALAVPESGLGPLRSGRPEPVTGGDTPAPRRVLPAIVASQLLGVTPWFAVNAVMPELRATNGWPAEALATLSSAVQWGFIAGTLLFALLAVADRFEARRVFLLCAFAVAGCTLAAAAHTSNWAALVGWRAATGFFLAGIYPVGMKIAAQWFPRGLGAALGWLLGALVIGSAFSHGLRAAGALGSGAAVPLVFYGVAALAATGGVLMQVLVPAAPGTAQPSPGLRLGALRRIVTDGDLRASAFGYFGHMWELYTVWVLVPLVLAVRLADGVQVSAASFVVLAAGALGCIGGGQLVRRFGSARVAGVQLAASGACCLLAPWMLQAPMPVFAAWLLVWGITVVGDSPQFSAMNAAHAPREAVGSVLTLINACGFAISAISIELFVRAVAQAPLAQVLPWLALGPALGLLALRPLWRR